MDSEGVAGVNESISPELCAALERFNDKAETMGWTSDWHCYPVGGPYMATQVDRWLDIGGGGPEMPAEPGTVLDDAPSS